MRTVCAVLALLCGASATATSAWAQSLTVIQHHVVGARLSVTPDQLYVPKSIPGSLRVDITDANGLPHPDARALAFGTHVEAVLRGPAFPAYRLLGVPNEPMLLPPIALAGEYQIDDIRLVDTQTGDIRMMGYPSRVPVHVFNELLVSQVTSRSLSLDEIKERGIVIDASNYSALEFQATFNIRGEAYYVHFPVVTPKFTDAIEVIPEAEREARLVEAERINARLSLNVTLPGPLQVPGLNVTLKAVNFQEAAGGDGEMRRMGGVIPAMVVIPGGVGFLNQFFSVQVFVANAAPAGSRLSVHSLQARAILPPGTDPMSSVDDPLRAARVGEETYDSRPIGGLGADGLPGTADDVARLQPGHTGQAELLLEGLREGLHVFDIELTGTLDGLASGEVEITGATSGSVLVRNPKFSSVFAHPRTIRSGEPYTASMTIMNTSETTANDVTISLHSASISGAELTSDDVVPLGNLGPGESATAEFAFIARRTGNISMATFSGDDGLSGRFDLTMGIDERGVELSAQVILYPDWVTLLPSEVRRAADRVLGQALSAATAAILPPGVRRPSADTVRTRVLELVEAGQRIGYGDEPERAYLDILLDWHGGRVPSLAFDQIMRETNAGAAMRTALLDAMAVSTDNAGLSWIQARATDVAGRGEAWGFAGSDGPDVRISVAIDGVESNSGHAQLPETGVYADAAGVLLVVREPSSWGEELEVVFRAPARPLGAPVNTSVGWVSTDGHGQGQRVVWAVTGNSSHDTCYRYFPTRNIQQVVVDPGCVNASSDAISVSPTSFVEEPPDVISVSQDLSVIVERPDPHCDGPSFRYFGRDHVYDNYGTLALVLFSKPMSEASVERRGAFTLSDAYGSGTTGVELQPGGRVALANFQRGFSALAATSLHFAPFIQDERGTSLASPPRSIDMLATEGVRVEGRVYAGSGEAVPNVPVTLTMHDLLATPLGCMSFDVRSSQVFSDSEGRFHFDYVMSGLPYTISATDIRGLSDGAVALLREAAPTGEIDPEELERLVLESGQPELWGGTRPDRGVLIAQSVDRAVFRDMIEVGGSRVGSVVPVALRFRGRATVVGRVVAGDGVTPVVDAAVNLFPDASSREQGRGMYSDSQGAFTFAGVPLGEVSLQVETSDGRSRAVSSRLTQSGEVREILVVLAAENEPRGSVAGVVFEADGVTPHSRAQVILLDSQYAVLATTLSGPDGLYRFTDIPSALPQAAVAISSDGRRTTAYRRLAVQPANTIAVNLVLDGTGIVVGRVERANGQAGAYALVAGGERVVRADADGNFRLTGVPVGSRRIAAALEVSTQRDIEFVRVGEVSATVLPGLTTYVVVRMPTAGRIQGRVSDASNIALPFSRVAIPSVAGFYWADANINGNFEFSPMALGSYSVNAPSPLVTDELGNVVENAFRAIESGAVADLEAALGQLIGARYSPPPPYVQPSGFGGTTTVLAFDGQTVQANIQYLPEGVISGNVFNHRGQPIAATVTLSSLTVSEGGGLATLPTGSTMSDPATGAFSFSGVEVGPYSVTAQSQAYPASVSARGLTSYGAVDASNIELQFAEAAATGGELTGIVLRDGSAAGAGVVVGIGSGDYEVVTTTAGTFRTHTLLHRGPWDVHASDPTTGREGDASVWIHDGRTAYVAVSLRSEAGELGVHVVDGAGQNAAGATVDVRWNAPQSEPRTAVTSTAGRALFTSLTEGYYSVRACRMTGQTRLCGGGSVEVPAQGRAQLALRLEPSGRVRGSFTEADGLTPVASAQVSIARGSGGAIAIVTTNEQGRFDIDGIPVGDVRVSGVNAVSGRTAEARGRVAAQGSIAEILLREDALADVVGGVLAADGREYAEGAVVTLTPSNPLFVRRTVTSDPGGQFSFAGVPPGPYIIDAELVLAGVRGRAFGVMQSPPRATRTDVRLDARMSLEVQVLEADGTPAGAASVLLRQEGFSDVDTDALGRVTLTNVPAGDYELYANSRRSLRTRSTVAAEVSIRPQTLSSTVVRLSGTGTVSGTVVTSLGAPVSGAEVVIAMTEPRWRGAGYPAYTESVVTGSTGTFTFFNVATGPFTVRAISGALGATRSGTIAADGQVVSRELTLTPSGTVRGRLLRADGSTLVRHTPIVISYVAPSGLSGAVTVRTSSLAAFQFESIPLGMFTLHASVPAIDAVLHRSEELDSSLTPVDLGDVLLDEESPFVEETLPVAGAEGVDVDDSIEVTFSEAMDPAFADTNAAYLIDSAGVRHPAELDWVEVGGVTTRLVLDPRDRLRSLTNYTVVVMGPRAPSGGSGYAGPGPVDMSNRAMVGPLVFGFTTQDSTPPVIESFTPGDHSEQVGPRSVVRVLVDEAVDIDTVQLVLRDANNAVVASNLSFGLADRLVVLTPQVALNANSRYTISLLHLTDRAGNTAAGLPRDHMFATLDTVGPTIASLVAVGSPRVGSVVPFAATLVVGEPDVQIHARVGSLNAPSQASTIGSNIVHLPLAAAGATDLYAFAIDRFGNHGPPFVGSVIVQANAPPTIAIVKRVPEFGRLLTGQAYSIDIEGADDSMVSLIEGRLEGAIERQATAVTSPLTFDGSVPATLGPGAVVVVHGIVSDNSGLVATSTAFSIPVGDGVAPSADLVASAALPAPNDSLSFTVTSSDHFGVASVQLAVTGAVSYTGGGAVSGTPTSDSRTFTMTVPSGAASAATIHAVATIQDAAGNSIQRTLDLRVADTVAPEVVSVWPPDDATDVPVGSSITVEFSEPVSGVSSTTLVLTSGGATIPTSVTLSPDGETATLDPLSALVRTTLYQVEVRNGIADLVGLAVAPQETTFVTEDVDVVGPRLVAIRPANGSDNAPLAPAIEYEFDEVMDATSLMGLTFTLEPASGGPPISTTRQLTHGNQRIRFIVPANTLVPGTEYEASLSGSPVDMVLNPATDDEGEEWVEVTTTFTTATIAIETWVGGYLSPANMVVEGHAAAVRVVGSSGAPIQRAQWFVDSTDVGYSRGGSPEWALAIPALLGSPITMDVGVDVTVTGAGAFVIDAVTLLIVDRDGDEDSDLIPNGVEVSAGTNPWVDDRLDDPDEDGMSNEAEVAAGTNPRDPDSDDDGILDGADLQPLTGNRAPSIGVQGQAESVGYYSYTGSSSISFPVAANIASPLTIEFWVTPTANRVSNILGTGATISGLNVGVDASHRFNVTITTVGDAPVRYDATFVSSTSTEHHLAVVYNGSRLRLFVDGRAAIDVAHTGALHYDAGARYGVPLTFRGVLDDVRIWSVARSAAEIQQTLHRVVTGPLGGLVGSWRFEDSGNRRFDSSGNGNHATLTSPQWSHAPSRYRDPTLATTSGGANFTLTRVDLDTADSITYSITRLPLHGRLFTPNINGVEVTAPGPVNSPFTFTYVADAGFVEEDEVEVIGSDGRASSLPLLIRFQTTTPLRIWTGASVTSSSSWTDPSNWTGSSVPDSSSFVVIPAGAPGPILTADHSVAGIYVGAGANLTVSGALRTFTTNSAVIDGAVLGLGRVSVAGNVRGNFGNLQVRGRTDLVGDVAVVGNLELSNILGIGVHEASVSGNLSASGAGGLTMTHGESLLEVDGDISFTGTNNMSVNLTAGTIRGRGNLTIDSQATYFDLSAGVTMELRNSSATTIQMNRAGYNRLGRLVVTSPTVTLSSPAPAGPTGEWLWASELVVGDGVHATVMTVAAGNVVIRDRVHVRAGSTLTVASLRALGVGSVAGQLNVTHLYLHNSVGGSQWTGLINASGGVAVTNLSVAAGNYTVSATTTVSGNLDIGASAIMAINRPLVVGGHLTSAGGGLTMTNPTSSIVEVFGNIHFSGNSAMHSLLTAGVIRGHGNIVVASGATYFILHGTEVQMVGAATTIQMEHAGANRFARLTVTSTNATLRAPSAPGAGNAWLWARELAVGDGSRETAWSAPSGAIVLGERIHVGASAAFSVANLQALAVGTVSGQLTVGSLRLHGGVGGQPTGSIRPSSGVHVTNLAVSSSSRYVVNSTVSIAGDLDIGSSAVVAVDSTLHVQGDLTSVGGGVSLVQPASLLEVEGDIRFSGRSMMHSSLTDGVIRGHGSFHALSDATYFILMGTQLQLVGDAVSIQMNYAGANRLSHLMVSGETVELLAPTAMDSSGSWLAADDLVVGDGSRDSNWAAPSGVVMLSGRVNVAASAAFTVATLQTRGVGTIAGQLGVGTLRLENVTSTTQATGAIHPAEGVIVSDIWFGGSNNYTVSSSLSVSGNLQIAQGRTLNVGRPVSVGGRLTSVGGGLAMNHATLSRVEVTGDILFSGNSLMTTLLTAGAIHGHRNFTVASAAGTFAPIGTEVHLNGGSGSIQMSHAGANVFSRLTVASASPTLLAPATAGTDGAWLAARELVVGDGTQSTSWSVPSGLVVVTERVHVGPSARWSVGTLRALGVGTVTGQLDVTDMRLHNSTLSSQSTGVINPGEGVSVNNLTFTGNANHTVSSTISIAGNLDVGSGRMLVINQPVLVGGNLTSVGGGLSMTQAGSFVDVSGNIQFSGNSLMSAASLTTGTMRTRGSFIVASSAGTFVTGNSLIVELAGPISTLRMDGAGASGNRLGALRVTSPNGRILLPNSAGVDTIYANTTRVAGTSTTRARLTVPTGASARLGSLDIQAYADVVAAANTVTFSPCAIAGGSTFVGYTCP